MVSESALRLPKDGNPTGSCGLIPRKEVLARAEKSHPECLFLEAHSVGPGSLRSLFSPSPGPHSPTSRASPLPLQLDGSRGAVFLGTCQSTLTGVIPEGLEPWGNRSQRILLLEDGRAFSLHFPSEKEKKKGRWEGRRE